MAGQRLSDFFVQRVVDRSGHAEFVQKRVDILTCEIGGCSRPEDAKLGIDGRDLEPLEQSRVEQSSERRCDHPVCNRCLKLFSHMI